MGKQILSVPERVRVALVDAQARCRPAQVHQSQVAKWLTSQLPELRLTVGAQRRFADDRLGPRIPGHPPPLALKSTKTGESPQSASTHHVLHPPLTPRPSPQHPPHS